MNNEIFDALLNYSDVQSKFLEQIALLEVDKLNSFTNSSIESIRQKAIAEKYYILSCVRDKIDEFKDASEYAKTFFKEFYRVSEKIAYHASLIAIGLLCKNIRENIFMNIDRYKKLKEDLVEEKNNLNEIIETSILKAEYKPLRITNYLMDKDYKNIEEVIGDKEVPYYVIEDIKSKIYFSSTDSENLEMLEFIRDRFYIILEQINNSIKELYKISNTIKKINDKYSKKRASSKDEVDYAFNDMINFVSYSKYQYLGDLIPILELYNPKFCALYGTKYYQIVKNWLRNMKQYIYERFLEA